VSSALIAAAVLLGALASAKVASFVRSERIIAQVRSLAKQDPKDLQASLGKAKEIADALKKNNLFVKEIPKEHPVKQVDGILGAEVLIGDKWYKVGEKVGDATIVAVAPTEVTVEWQGQKKTFAPLATASAPQEPPSKPAEAKPEEAKAPEPGKPAPPPAPVAAKAATPAENDALSWMGVTLSPKLRAKLLEYWNTMSEEDKERAKQEWNRMPEEERDKALDKMEEKQL
jgi:hypothetical protein